MKYKTKSLVACMAMLVGFGLCAQTLPPAISATKFLSTRPAEAAPLNGAPEVRIFGWSADGKIAYVFTRSIDGRGGDISDYCIQDLVTDELVWRLRDDSFDQDGNPKAGSGDAAQDSYQRSAAQVRAALAKFRIVAGSGELQASPIVMGGQRYKIELTVAKKPGDDFMDQVANYAVAVRGQGGKAKTILRKPKVEAVGVQICGWLASPFEPRVAVLVAEERFVFEGTELFFQFVGCDMGKGLQ